ncbi:MAG: ABC transporter substrate-binding protein [Acidobacteriota bacterium]
MKAAFALILAILSASCGASSPRAETHEIRIPKGAGGVGFLPLLVMEKNQLIEKHAREAGIVNLTVKWIDLGGPSAVNDALLSGSADFTAAGPPAFLTLWDRTRDSAKVTGVAAIASLPMYLNTRAAHLKQLEDLTAQDKIALTAIKVSIPAIIMQMYSRQKYGDNAVARFDKYTVSMTHPDAVIALLAGSGAITAHFSSPPFHQRERKDPQVRTILTSDQVLGGPATFAMLAATAKFHEENPELVRAVIAALDEANRMIAADRPMAAQLLLASAGGGGLSADELVNILNDPAIRFTTTPENVMKYAEFMHATGSLKNKPASWKDLFFPELHAAPGN